MSQIIFSEGAVPSSPAGGKRAIFASTDGIYGLDSAGGTTKFGAGGGAFGALAAGTQTATSGTIVFANSNGITFGLNGSTQITASHNGLTTAAASNHSHGNPQLNLTNLSGTTASNSAGLTLSLSAAGQSAQPVAISGSNGSFNFSTVTMGNLNGVSFYTSNGSLVASHNALTTARASTDAVGLATAQTNVTWTVNSAGLSFNAAGYAGTGTTTAGANISLSATLNSAGLNLSASVGAPGGAGSYNILAAGTQTAATTGTVLFSNSNGITFGMSNSSIVTASHNGITSQTAQTIGGYFVGNTTGQSSSSTADLRSLSVDGGGIVSAGWSGGSIRISATQSNQAVSGSNGSFTFQTLSLGNSNGVSFLTSNGSIVASITSQRTGSYFANMPYIVNTATMTFNQSTSYIFPIDVKGIESIGFARLLHNVNMTSTSFASTANTDYSYNQQATYNLVLYTRGTGASSQSLLSIGSTSVSAAFSVRLSRNTTDNISVTHGITFPTSAGSSTLSFSYAATNSSDQFSTTHLTALTAAKLWDTQFATLLDKKMYWVMVGMTSTQTTQNVNLSGIRTSASYFAITQMNNPFGMFGNVATASLMPSPGLGSFSTAGGGTVSGLNLSNISSSASHPVPWIQFLNVA